MAKAVRTRIAISLAGVLVTAGSLVACGAANDSLSDGPNGDLLKLDADTESLSPEQVRAHTAYVLELLARRNLTPEEFDAAGDEFLSHFDNAECTVDCVAAIRQNAETIRPVREMQGQPADFRVRHQFISALYFSPEQTGSLIQRISAEADPILVVNNASRQLMTRADVVGAMNLKKLADEGVPEAGNFTDEQIEGTTTALNQAFGMAAPTPPPIPFRLQQAAAFWAGAEQSWDDLTTEEQNQVRVYFSDASDQPPLSSKLYGTLLSLEPAAAEQVAIDEIVNYNRALLLDIALQSALFQLDLNTIQSYVGPYPGY